MAGDVATTETEVPPAIGAAGARVGSSEALKRQGIAGTVVGGVRQPELSSSEREAIVGANDNGPDEATRAALKRQASAGTGGQPELTKEERNLIAAYNASLQSRR